MRWRSAVLGAMAACLVVAACAWDPSRPFDRESPVVNEAIGALDGGDAQAAAGTLESYLSTGACADGNIGAPEVAKKRPDGTFDLGLSLFKIGESYGRRFGEEELDAGGDEKARALRGAEIGCALRVLGAIADGPNTPLPLRARARYLEGNLNFLDASYEAAVHAYDGALTLAPGESDAGDPVGRDAAWNRAIALKRIEDKKDAGQDAPTDGPKDSAGDAPKDGANDSGGDSGKDSGGQGDSGKDSSAGEDSGAPDAGQQPPPPSPKPDAGPPPPPRANEDDRMLDQLESAPTVQEEVAKKAAGRRKVRGMADK